MPKSLKPDEELRRRVKTLSGIGMRPDQICDVIGLRSVKTLRRHFAKELDAGRAEAIVNVQKTVFERAVSGRDPAMTIFALKVRAGWRPGMMAAEKTDGTERIVYLYGDYELPGAPEQDTADPA